MPIITGIEPQKRNPQRVNVYLDGVYAFPLALSVAIKAGLKKGQCLTSTDVERLVATDSLEKAYERALNFLSFRPRSSAEVRRYLTEKGVDTSLVEPVIARLTQAGLLDDAAFAHSWVENRQQFNPRGRRVLRQELMQKGIERDVIEAVLPADEEEASPALAIARRRAAALAGQDYPRFRQKLSAYLLRRGFDYEVVSDIVSRVWREQQTGQVTEP